MTKHESKLVHECCMIARSKGLAAVRLEKTGNKGVPDYILLRKAGKRCSLSLNVPTVGALFRLNNGIGRSFSVIRIISSIMLTSLNS